GIVSLDDYTDSGLPVEMTSFNATSSGLSAQLNWLTVTEKNNEGFEVQRSAVSGQLSANSQTPTAGSWTKVGFVPGAGTSTSAKQYNYVDKNVPAGTYAYRLKQIDRDGTFAYSSVVNVEVGLAPKVFSLSQNYPNPFNPTTSIEFTVPSDGRASLKVFDILGREVATLVDGEVKAGVLQQATFDASKMSSGIYFARLQFGGKQLMKKMVLMK
ncbi:MAG TPA: T9SS type A sorting domain-containing protein, partial [Bacteroidota bacterium]|nr:T9SS type A sorting domain-containing protein [Bacteroidota bacterium]